MKTLVFKSCIIVFAILFFQTISFAQDEEINGKDKILTLKVNGEVLKSDIPAIIFEDRVWVSARTVIGKLGGKIQWDEWEKKITISQNNKTIEMKLNSKNKGGNANIKIINKHTFIPLRFVAEELGLYINWLPEERTVVIESINIEKYSILKNIKYFKRENKTVVSITFDNLQNLNIFELSNPKRILIDITGAILFDKNRVILPSIDFVSKISLEQLDASKSEKIYSNSSTVSIAIDVDENTNFHCVKNDNTLEIILSNVLSNRGDSQRTINKNVETSISKPYTVENKNLNSLNLNNFEYLNTGDRVVGFIYGAQLSKNNNKERALYDYNYHNEGKQYQIIFPYLIENLESGIIYVNDGMIDSIEIIKDSTTKIIFNTKIPFLYNISPDPEEDKISITILKTGEIGDKLVVIDPGHGGKDSGATYGDVKEKDLNLNIAQKLKGVLKSKGIKTYITRDDDRFVGLYERTDIANKLNASLFISIHNNAYVSSARGTETLYYDNGSSKNNFNGKVYAQTIQKGLINKLGTYDRGIVPRPNLVVLNATNMPSVLVEVGFITNGEDREKLLREDFLQSAAVSLADSIIKALGELGN